MSRRLIAAAALTLLAATAAASAPLAAQAATPAAAPLLAPRVNALTTQPISVILGIYNLEYERAIGPSTSIGAYGSYASTDFGDIFENDRDERYSTLEGKVRYYPSGRVFTGFSIAGTLGVVRYSSIPNEGICFFDSCPATENTERVSATGAKLGFELDYNWLLGADQKFVVALGVGAKRQTVRDKTTSDGAYTVDYPQVVPTARIAIGFAW